MSTRFRRFIRDKGSDFRKRFFDVKSQTEKDDKKTGLRYKKEK